LAGDLVVDGEVTTGEQLAEVEAIIGHGRDRIDGPTLAL
jgi:hypothetical protein